VLPLAAAIGFGLFLILWRPRPTARAVFTSLYTTSGG
jgi:hypothetical protein